MKIAIGVKPLQELISLICEIAFNLEKRPEITRSPILAFIGLLQPIALKFALKLLLQKFSGKVRYVCKLTCCGKSLLGPLAIAVFIVVTAVPFGIVGNGATTNHVKRKSLRVERSGRSNDTGAIGLSRATRNPIHHLHTAEAAANQTCQMFYASLGQEHTVDIHRIGEIISRELASVGPACIRIDGRRTCSAAAPTKHIGAYHMISIRIYGTPWTYHPFPPSARLRLSRTYTRHMGISCKRMAYEHDIIKLWTYRTTLLISHINALKHSASTEFEATFRKIKSH